MKLPILLEETDFDTRLDLFEKYVKWLAAYHFSDDIDVNVWHNESINTTITRIHHGK